MPVIKKMLCGHVHGVHDLKRSGLDEQFLSKEPKTKSISANEKHVGNADS